MLHTLRIVVWLAAAGLWLLVVGALLVDMARHAPALLAAFMAALAVLYPLLRALERRVGRRPAR